MKITKKDKHNLLDLIYICVDDEDRKDLESNGLGGWFKDFFSRLEDYCIPEIFDEVKSDES